MTCSIMQPTFNPWIGYFDLIDSVDKFIILDTVQLNQQSWQTRNKIKVQDNELLVSIPIQKSKSKSKLFIKDTLIDFRKFDFRKKLIKTIEQNYSKSKYYKDAHTFIKELILFDTDYLSCYNNNIIKQICKKLNIKTEIVLLSQTEYSGDNKKGEQVLDICRFFKVDEYISPVGSKDYLKNTLNDFITQNIEIKYQNYKHPKYQQLGNLFIQYIGIFDLLYNEGFDNSINIIKSGRTL